VDTFYELSGVVIKAIVVVTSVSNAMERRKLKTHFLDDEVITSGRRPIR
jgi:hypothetical protein